MRRPHESQIIHDYYSIIFCMARREKIRHNRAWLHRLVEASEGNAEMRAPPLSPSKVAERHEMKREAVIGLKESTFRRIRKIWKGLSALLEYDNYQYELFANTIKTDDAPKVIRSKPYEDGGDEPMRNKFADIERNKFKA